MPIFHIILIPFFVEPHTRSKVLQLPTEQRHLQRLINISWFDLSCRCFECRCWFVFFQHYPLSIQKCFNHDAAYSWISIICFYVFYCLIQQFVSYCLSDHNVNFFSKPVLCQIHFSLYGFVNTWRRSSDWLPAHILSHCHSKPTRGSQGCVCLVTVDERFMTWSQCRRAAAARPNHHHQQLGSESN